MPSRPSDTISSARPFGARSSVALENPALSGFSDLGSFGGSYSHVLNLSKTRLKPTIIRTPRDYISATSTQSVGRDIPVFCAPVRQDQKWEALANHLNNNRRMVL
ncbi:unnamed protein product [Penicillium roqueforti FM164]|uniref:Genomic scaffold, ProqFM164S02 n=1 Tax=Penicillium roqueforti (strain FM164) TaxID=1365484 RepID=W6Q8M2_PENRF|nr:unnamed protein product [Penicillium roqueforti FM164]